MTKYLVCVFTIAVLLGGVTSDLLMCVLKQIDPINPGNFVDQPDTVCEDNEEKFRLARAGLRNCFGFDIDIARLESLHHEFCSPNSDFREKAERQRECFSKTEFNKYACASVRQKIMDPKHELLNPTELDNSINIVCQSLAAEMTHCTRKNFGGSCGKEGKEVLGRIAEGFEPLMKGLCLSAARFGIDGGVPSDEFEKKFVYSSTVDSNPFSVYTSTIDSNSYAASAVTVHSFTYYLLLGLIFIVNW